ncbi:sarcosine oxidase subunit gamma [Collimonas pratensis]|uniref:Sarcosine oxidase, gamma subunit n=1 Tax=Collimonas pratensis TaxID=279113 RepID=A0A127Q167_9BURK|nr:sarcosine oxidase subunit gamma family protein [Collimonas pratensis]AMP03818.1 sarcosine oxidase, gamma subunit [Collimonas pratensis]
MLNETQLFQVQQESPLAELGQLLAPLTAGANQPVRLEEKPFLELINIKGEAGSASFLRAVKNLTGAALPLQPNTIAESEQFVIYWLAPNEWLIQSRQPRLPALCADLAAALAGEFAAVVDVSSGNTSLVLSGIQARAVLQKGCPLDFHAGVFKPGQCAQSHYFKAGILLRPLDDGAFELIIRRSFADYFGRILLDASQEYL